MKLLRFILPLLCFSSQVIAAELGAGIVPPAYQKANINYWGNFQPKTDFSNNDESALYRGTVIASVPFNKTETSAWTVSTLGHYLDLSPDQEEIPDLYQFDIGLSYTQMIEGGKMWAINGNFGSASDQPFKNSSVDTVSGNYFYVSPTNETESWIFLVNYSNNRPILNNIPIPGFAYMYSPSKAFRGTFGIPFASIKWDFAERWTWNMFYLIPWVIKTSVDFTVAGPVKVYTGLDFSANTYYLAKRDDVNERLFYDEKKVFIGTKLPLSKSYLAEFDAGYAFDRRYFKAKSYEQSPADPVTLGTSPYVRLSITALL
jgi:hypothetical protein